MRHRHPGMKSSAENKEAMQEDAIRIREGLSFSEIDLIVRLHREVYETEYGFGGGFFDYVRKAVEEYFQDPHPSVDRFWIAESNSGKAGCLSCRYREPGIAQLRFFLVLPAYRNQGLGRRLMELFQKHLGEAGIRHCYLLTTAELERAARLYLDFGFRLTETTTTCQFGKPAIEQRYDWHSTH